MYVYYVRTKKGYMMSMYASYNIHSQYPQNFTQFYLFDDLL